MLSAPPTWRERRTKSALGWSSSTDYVFGGEGRPRHDPHTESSKPGPCNVYGARRRTAGHECQSAASHHPVGRSLRHSHQPQGLDLPRTDGIKGRSDGWVKVVTDQALSPTYTRDLAKTTQALMDREARGLFHLRTRVSARGTSSPRQRSTSPASRSPWSPRRRSPVNGVPDGRPTPRLSASG